MVLFIYRWPVVGGGPDRLARVQEHTVCAFEFYPGDRCNLESIKPPFNMNTTSNSICLAPLRNSQSESPEVSPPGPQTIAQPGAENVPTPTPRSLRVLCIDDDESILEFMKDCLAHFGHQVKVASGGKYGMELFSTAILKSEPYDVVVTDLGMPDINGYQVARAIKAESPNTPVVMMTGEGVTTKDGGALAGAVDVVVNKPPRMQELNDLLLRVAARNGND